MTESVAHYLARGGEIHECKAGPDVFIDDEEKHGSHLDALLLATQQFDWTWRVAVQITDGKPVWDCWALPTMKPRRHLDYLPQPGDHWRDRQATTEHHGVGHGPHIGLGREREREHENWKPEPHPVVPKTVTDSIVEWALAVEERRAPLKTKVVDPQDHPDALALVDSLAQQEGWDDAWKMCVDLLNDIREVRPGVGQSKKNVNALRMRFWWAVCKREVDAEFFYLETLEANS